MHRAAVGVLAVGVAVVEVVDVVEVDDRLVAAVGSVGVGVRLGLGVGHGDAFLEGVLPWIIPLK
ncbi:hypothetical protein GCM10028815_01780 [Mariniluteicoccus flavus]